VTIYSVRYSPGTWQLIACMGKSVYLLIDLAVLCVLYALQFVRRSCPCCETCGPLVADIMPTINHRLNKYTMEPVVMATNSLERLINQYALAWHCLAAILSRLVAGGYWCSDLHVHDARLCVSWGFVHVVYGRQIDRRGAVCVGYQSHQLNELLQTVVD